MDQATRQKLDKLILAAESTNWWQPDRFLVFTKPRLPAELEIVQDPPVEKENYNCFLYMLGLHTNQIILASCQGFIYDNFIRHLLKLGLLIETGAPQIGDYILYRDIVNYPNAITHGGILEGDGRVMSKWAWGPLVRHQPLAVPASYGDDIFYAKKVTVDQGQEWLEKYQKHNKRTGISIK